MSYLSGMLHSLQPLHFFTCCQYVKKLLRYDHFNTCQLIYTPKWAGAIGWLGNVSMLECNRWSKEEGEWIGSSSCCVTSVWWHGTKLRARLALTAAFAHSNASCRPGPRPLSCCQHTDRLSWIISYLPNLSLQRRASSGRGGLALNRTAMVHRLQASFMGTLAPLSLLLCLFWSISCSIYFSIELSCFQLRIPSLSFHLCLLVTANLKSRADGRWKQ